MHTVQRHIDWPELTNHSNSSPDIPIWYYNVEEAPSLSGHSYTNIHQVRAAKSALADITELPGITTGNKSIAVLAPYSAAVA
ncbi:unnamed protein product [Bursaphelenchus okinawaensis]|uniref:DNA2/NAM7 helicase-like C-terminal domain-containing protein n=1 Tax=Bursaphelenchus okinawaensis TaxID=465554 RepID=A0A811JQP1_9BILA|nr:unnamed protein product [Bursaphelenchus okinawaensis]CAG9078792.1 unnamed protein product [Bursaphelenchus okinawaensis]